jgi:hypothetical protein
MDVHLLFVVSCLATRWSFVQRSPIRACDLETSTIKRSRADSGCCATKKKQVMKNRAHWNCDACPASVSSVCNVFRPLLATCVQTFMKQFKWLKYITQQSDRFSIYKYGTVNQAMSPRRDIYHYHYKTYIVHRGPGWGSVVVKALRCQSEGLGIDPQWRYWGYFPRLPTEPCALRSTQPLKMSTTILLVVKTAGA